VEFRIVTKADHVSVDLVQDDVNGESAELGLEKAN